MKNSNPTLSQVRNKMKEFGGYREKSICNHPQALIKKADDMGEHFYYCESPALDYRFIFTYNSPNRPDFTIVG